MKHYVQVSNYHSTRRVTKQELGQIECLIPIWQGLIADVVIGGLQHRGHLRGYEYEVKPGDDGLHGITFDVALLVECEDSRSCLNDLIGWGGKEEDGQQRQ